MAKRGRPPGSGVLPEDAKLLAAVLARIAAEPALSAGQAITAEARKTGEDVSENQRRRIKYAVKQQALAKIAEKIDFVAETGLGKDVDTIFNSGFLQHINALSPKSRARAITRRQQIVRDYRQSIDHYKEMASAASLSEHEIGEGLLLLRALLVQDITADMIKVMATIDQEIYSSQTKNSGAVIDAWRKANGLNSE